MVGRPVKITSSDSRGERLWKHTETYHQQSILVDNLICIWPICLHTYFWEKLVYGYCKHIHRRSIIMRSPLWKRWFPKYSTRANIWLTRGGVRHMDIHIHIHIHIKRSIFFNNTHQLTGDTPHLTRYTVKPVCNDHLYNDFFTCNLFSNVF